MKYAKNLKAMPIAAFVAATVGLSATATAGTVTGRIVDDSGQPVAGAMVRLDGGLRAEAVFADADGNYSISTEIAGDDLDIRFRRRYHDDVNQTISLASDEQLQLDVALTKITDIRELTEAAPSLAHFSQLPFEESGQLSRLTMVARCVQCHQLGNPLTRWSRTPEQWLPTLQNMSGQQSETDLPTASDSQMELADFLSRGFTGSLLPRAQLTLLPYQPEWDNAKFYEWDMPEGEVPHDIEIVGKYIYSGDMREGTIVRTDTELDQVEYFPIPVGDVPENQLRPNEPYAARGPHSLVQAKQSDGNIYITDSYGGALIEMDLETNEFTNYQVGRNSFYPHTIREGRNSMVWSTIIASNQVAGIHTETKEITIVQLPVNQGFEAPYGLDINPNDGSIWYAKIGAGRIGRIDPDTLEVTEYDSPVEQPRRQRFDANGNLWIAGYGNGTIARVEIDGWRSRVWELPVYAEGQIMSPYALAVHPQTQEIWINDTQMDALLRFIPEREEFIAYPTPLKGTYTRDVVFNDKGWACASNNPVPLAALEYASVEVFCVDANSGED